MAIEKIVGQPPIEKANEVIAPETKNEKVEIRVEKNIPGSKPEQESVKALEKSGEALVKTSPQAQSLQKKREIEIDNILADGLSEVFLKMNPAQQKEFKAKGEETVKKIVLLLEKTKVKVDKIITLIKKWLKLIPGVNKFFLEQETKLKADKIISLKVK